MISLFIYKASVLFSNAASVKVLSYTFSYNQSRQLSCGQFFVLTFFYNYLINGCRLHTAGNQDIFQYWGCNNKSDPSPAMVTSGTVSPHSQVYTPYFHLTKKKAELYRTKLKSLLTENRDRLNYQDF